MIALKLPKDAADHPYMLSTIVAATGSSVSKGDPLFKLVRAGTLREITFRAPVDGKVGSYLVGGTDLLSEPGQHVVTMEKTPAVSEKESAQGASATKARPTDVSPLKLYLPDEPDLFPVRIDEWLIGAGENAVLDQPLVKVTLADGRPWVFKSPAAGCVANRAEENGGYVTQMAPMICTVEVESKQRAERPSAVALQAPPKPTEPATRRQDLCSMQAPVLPIGYPMSVIAWFIKVGDYVGQNQVVGTIRSATGELSPIRNIYVGRVRSCDVKTEQFFGEGDILYVVDQADLPPSDWKVPSDPSQPNATAKPAPKAQESMANAARAATKQVAENETKPEHSIPDDPEWQPRKQPAPSSSTENALGLFGLVFGMVAWVGLGVFYGFNGSRIVFTGWLVLILVFYLAFIPNPIKSIVVTVLLLSAGIFMILPQDLTLHPKTTAWEPFGIGAITSDGERHGDFWENMNRPKPTKRQQAEFNAWLEN